MADEDFHKACAVPFRRRDGRLEFCVISSRRNRSRWSFPKGSVEPDETVPEAALKEAHEEAGVRGRLVGEPLGDYELVKYAQRLRVAVYLLEVTEEDDVWLESSERDRRWVTPQQASALLKSEHRRFLQLALRRLAAS
jgi:8-oxo-dGTP pyrophosphatase MutT (NUDIX family)